MRNALGYIVITLLVIGGGVCAWFFVETDNALAPAQWRGGEIRVGYSSEPPYAFRTADGTVTGQSPEIAKAVLAKLGVSRIRWVLMDFSQTIPELLSGHIDMIANGMFITPERASRIAFSLPYSRTAQGLLTRRGNPKGLHAYADVAARSDVVAAVLAGSIEQQTLLRLGMSPARLFVVPEPADGLAAVRQGRADCLALSAPTVAWMADNAPEEVEAATPFRGPGDTLAVGRSAFGFRREDVHLRRAVDQALLGYIGTPEQLRRVQPFGFGPPSLPEWRPAP